MSESKLYEEIKKKIGNNYDPTTIGATPATLAKEIRNLKDAIYMLTGAIEMLMLLYKKGD